MCLCTLSPNTLTSFSLDVDLVGDGIFDKWDTKEIVDSVWTHLQKAKEGNSAEARTRVCESLVNHVILSSMKKMSYDNLTGILLNFNCF